MAETVWLATTDGEGMLTGVGRAQRVVRAVVRDGSIVEWKEDEVRWDLAHEQREEGRHHAQVAKFLLAHPATGLVAAGAGPDMKRMLAKAGILLRLSGGSARDAIVEVAAQPPATTTATT